MRVWLDSRWKRYRFMDAAHNSLTYKMMLYRILPVLKRGTESLSHPKSLME